MNNRFGMFIHWGMYAQTQQQEQAIARYDMTHEEYDELIHVFNPQNYDPEQWVLLAKECGMKYICFTTKHHDGFCMWDTKYTDYNIMHTPYGKDVLKMLADACHKHGIELGLYYSVPDWHHPNGFNPVSTHQWKSVDPAASDTVAYRTYIKNQITELLTNYGKISNLFWDIPPKMEDRSINELVRKLMPGIQINDRGYDEGDYGTPEREYESDDTNRPFTKMTEACNAIGEQSWGYRKEEDFYSFRHLTHAIDRFMALGAGYLLNIGPRPDGTLDPVHVARMRRIGDWYTRLGGCLENHEPDPFDYRFVSRKVIATKKDGKTYFHFYDGVCSTALALKTFPSLPKRIKLLNTGVDLPFAVEPLPEYFDMNTGKCDGEYLHIRNIPVDDLESEAIVLEVTW